MADNFRNKQWFKNLTQDRKDEICKKFDIDEKTLRKAGRETEDGRIVVNLLKIDHINTIPELWIQCYTAYENIFNSSMNWDIDSIEEMCLRLEYLYSLKNHEVKWLKYKNSLRNDLYVKDAYERTRKWINIANENLNDQNYVRFCSYQIYSQCKCLLESDLKIVK